MRTVLRLTIAATALSCVFSAPIAWAQVAWAQDASDWDTQAHTAARLIAGATAKTSGAAIVRAGIEIKLDPGWKTYWRDPGDSGVPPTFDFSGSDNVKSATVLWPAPEQFPDGAGGNSIGYVDHVILPVEIAPQDPAKKPSLQLKLGYAICGTLCVPVEANLKLALDGDGAEDAAIERAEVRVPRHVSLGPGQGLAILAVHREPGDGHDRVVVDVAAPAGTPVNLFVEGPTPEWSLPLPEPMAGTGATRQFSFDLDGLPPGATPKGATLTLTAVSGDDAIEVPAHLD
jgi:DsbC/DsbD-like thiol-disulfide interchange protein